MATDDGKREDGWGNNSFTPWALKLIGLGVISFLCMAPFDDVPFFPFVFIFGIGAVSLIIGVGYFLFKLLLKGVFEIFKAANKGSAEGSTRRPEDSP